MKKVMVLTIVITLLATSAWAVVRNTKHDLSSTSGNTVASTNYSETCVFCHTPHGGQTGMLAPLWNRSHLGKTYVAAELYNSATLEAGSMPTAVVGPVSRSDAQLCMSCHDGTSLNAGLLNPANSAGVNVQPAFTNDTVSADANLGNDLTNDHPIGMDYPSVRLDDGELIAATGTSPDLKVDVLPLFWDSTTGNDVMWCSSCHDVHDNSFEPFLMKDNAGSALCTTCHVK